MKRACNSRLLRFEPAFHSDAVPDPDPTFQFDADSGSLIQIWTIQYPKITLPFDADPYPDLAFHFHSNPDPDPAFQFDVDLDPDPASKNDANPCGFGSITLPTGPGPSWIQRANND